MILLLIALPFLLIAPIELAMLLRERRFRREMTVSRRPLYVNGKLVTNSVGGAVYV